MTTEPLRIGTRDSILATWQARYVREILLENGWPAELHYIKTEGDRVLDTPLPLMGGKGVFTKALDDALLSGGIDLAVHSFKDIPTRMPDGLKVGAVSRREDVSDVFVSRESASGGAACRQKSGNNRPSFPDDPEYRGVVASSSNRRIGQWLARYPNFRVRDIRGNIQTRLRKVAESDWDGAIFAAAGLKRLGLQHHIAWKIDWMLPAPAQGAMAVMVRSEDERIKDAVLPVDDPDTALCTGIERDVLHTLEGGCSAPVGAFAEIRGRKVHLKVNTVYPDGSGLIAFEMSEDREKAGDLGRRAADEALGRGADTLIRDLREGRNSPGAL